MVGHFLLPHIAAVSLAYVRLRTHLSVSAIAMQEHQSVETIRAMYDALQLERPQQHRTARPGSCTAPAAQDGDEACRSPIML